MHFWRNKTNQAFDKVTAFFAWLFGCGLQRLNRRNKNNLSNDEDDDDDDKDHDDPLRNGGTRLRRATTTTSTLAARNMRIRRPPTLRYVSRQSVEAKGLGGVGGAGGAGGDEEHGRLGARSCLAEMWIEERDRKREGV